MLKYIVFVILGSCSKITELMPSIHCVDDYSRPKEEKKTFKEQWMLPTPNVTYIPTSVMQPFQYDSVSTGNKKSH